jgi:hypothetical protein
MFHISLVRDNMQQWVYNSTEKYEIYKLYLSREIFRPCPREKGANIVWD